MWQKRIVPPDVDSLRVGGTHPDEDRRRAAFSSVCPSRFRLEDVVDFRPLLSSRCPKAAGNMLER
jgi:hypothetical protein